jgi:hypothetical protein
MDSPKTALFATLKFGWTIFMPVWTPGLHLYVFPTASDLPSLWSMHMVETAVPFNSTSLAPTVWDMMTVVNIKASDRLLYTLLSPSSFFWLTVVLVCALAWALRRGWLPRTLWPFDRSFFVAVVSCLLFMFLTGFIIPSPEVRYTWWIYPIAATVAGVGMVCLAQRLGRRTPGR